MKKSVKYKLSLSLSLMVILLSTSIYAISLPSKVLTLNSRGEDVVNVQKALNILGSKLSVDGIYGKGTKQAVLNFQKTQYAINNDGVYGPATQNLLEKAISQAEGGDNNSGSTPEINLPNGVLKYMSKGPSVTNLQKVLNLIGYKLTEDGIYGRATQEAVRDYQSKNYYLTSDGIYGPATKAALQDILREI